jgi:hypothetical protein
MKPMHSVLTMLLALSVSSAVSAVPTTVQAQRGVAERIAAVRTGTIRMTFAAKEGVCGDGMNWFRLRASGYSGSFINSNISGTRDVNVTCNRGPVRLVIVRDGGETTQLRTYVGGTWKVDTGYTDLGDVPARDIGAWLLNLAETAGAKPARSAITAATITDSVEVTASLLRIVKNDDRPADVRSSALNWLGEVAGDKVASTLDSIAYEPGDRDVRRQAIYAISRRPADEAIPALLKMAESLPDRELRRTAVQTLVRSKDPRAVQWLERQLGR